MHFLPSAEVFSGFLVVTPLGKTPNKKATKVSCLPPRPKDFLIFCVALFIPHYLALSNNLFIATGMVPRISQVNRRKSQRPQGRGGISEYQGIG